MGTVVIDGDEYEWDDDEYDEPYHDPELLYELYYIEQISSLHKIGDYFDVDGRTIKSWLEKGGYSTRSISESHQLNTVLELRDEEELRQMYHEEWMSLREIANELDVHHEHVRYWMEEHGIERRDRLYTKRHMNPVHVHTHPHSGHVKVIHVYDGERWNVELHRLVVVAEEGVDALDGNIVHHRNHHPFDNRPENLELMSKEEHGVYHGAGKTEWGEVA